MDQNSQNVAWSNSYKNRFVHMNFDANFGFLRKFTVDAQVIFQRDS